MHSAPSHHVHLAVNTPLLNVLLVLKEAKVIKAARSFKFYKMKAGQHVITCIYFTFCLGYIQIYFPYYVVNIKQN